MESTKSIEIKLTETEYARLQSIAEMTGKSSEFIAKMGMFLYMHRLENEIKRKEGIGLLNDIKLVDGYFDGDRFVVTEIGGTAINSVYRAEGLRSLGRLIEGDDPVTLTIDKDNVLYIPVELNGQVARELVLIADELERRG